MSRKIVAVKRLNNLEPNTHTNYKRLQCVANSKDVWGILYFMLLKSCVFFVLPSRQILQIIKKRTRHILDMYSEWFAKLDSRSSETRGSIPLLSIGIRAAIRHTLKKTFYDMLPIPWELTRIHLHTPPNPTCSR